ncbi:MAG: V-type ATP synthase subunit I, partial [Halobacteriaceae archaeon]
FDFFKNLPHGLRDAVLESGSWFILMWGMWLWIFSVHLRGLKPPFMYDVFSSGSAATIPLGFTGFALEVGYVGLALTGLGIILAVIGEVSHLGLPGLLAGAIESITRGFGHVLSYTRIAAVLLAKAGMALAVNLLVFGAQLHEGEFHFLWTNGLDPATTDHVIFAGLFNAGVAGAIFGLVVLLAGHALVLALGITSAGLQAIRLEYMEFFNKFYDGGGAKYDPFGYERTYTTED